MLDFSDKPDEQITKNGLAPNDAILQDTPFTIPDAALPVPEQSSEFVLFLFLSLSSCCGPPAMLEGPFRFSLSRCLYIWMDECMDGGCSSTKKVNLY